MTCRLKPHHLFKSFLLASFLLIVIACDHTGMSEQQMLQNAKAHLDKGELMAASIELRNTLKKNNENAEARYLLGSINLKVGDLTSAEKEFRRAADAGWSQEAVQLQLARILISKKAFKQLLDEVNPAATWSADTRADIAGLRALAEAGLNDITNAKNTLEEGRVINKDAVQILKTTAILQKAGMLEGDASSTLENALLLHADNPEILFMHASNDIQNKNHTRAAETYSRIISLDPAKIQTANGRKARIVLTRLQIVEEDYITAETTLAPLLKISDKDPEVNYLAGLLAFTQYDLSRAEDHIRKLLAVMPDYANANQLMGKIKYAQKDYDQAAHHLSKYLNAAPDDNTVRKLLANTYIILNKPDQARSTLQSALSANPDDAASLTLLSQIELKGGNTNAGIAALKKAIKSSPDDAQLHKQLAKTYTLTGQTELARNEITSYQKLSNDTDEAQKLSISNYLKAGQIDKALEIANHLLTKEPDNPNILALIGGLYANNGDNQSARSSFNKALKIQRDHPTAAMGLAGVERKIGNLDIAIALYESLVNSNQAGTAPMLELSRIAAQQNRTKDMLTWLEKARNTAPKEIRAYTILAKYYLQDAQPKEAEVYAREAIKQSPEHADIIALLGRILIEQKRYNEALPPLKKLVLKFPESTTAQSLLGEAFLRQHMLADARKHLQKALMIQQDNIIAMGLLAETELKDGKPVKSLEYARAVQKRHPEYYIGHMLEGDTWMAKKNYKRAHSAYDNAWKRQQTAQLAQRLFLALKDTPSLDEAITPLLTWLKSNPGDNPTRLYLASVYQRAGENDKAITEYEKILVQTPDDSTVLNNLAWLYSLNGNPKAMDMAERAYRFSAENPGILDTYGWILLQHGQIEKGQRLIKQAMDMIPGNPDIRYHYASALLKSGNGAEGKQMLEELLNQDKPFGGREEAKKLLKTL